MDSKNVGGGGAHNSKENGQSHLFVDDENLIRDLDKLGLSERIIKVLIGEKDKPEGKIRILWIRKLVTEYGYPASQLDINVPAGVGRDAGKRNTPAYADIVVYRNQVKTQPFVIVETKAPNKKQGLEQAESYSRNLGGEYHVWSDGQYSFFFRTARYANLSEPIGDIPRWVGDKPLQKKVPKTQELPPFKDEEELRKVIGGCHDLILEKQGHDPAKAFDEITKLLFLKLYDEREVPKFYEFAVLVDEKPKDVAERIRELFSTSVTSSKYKDVFYSIFNKQPDISLQLDDITIFNLVQKLQGYSLVNTTENIHGADIKGTVFEQMVGNTFRGELAQYFTPREIVDFVVDFLKPTKDDSIVDPACGSGGFLIMALRKVKERIKHEFPNLPPNQLDQHVKYFAEHNMYGVDINERMVRVAKMNMIMHGDGHAGIIHTSGLLLDPEIPKQFLDGVKDCTIIVSNPPFAGTEKDPTVLQQFEVSTNKQGTPVTVSKELLFIEKIIKMSKVGARIGLVIPSGCFNNVSPPYIKLRNLIRKYTKITALIGLPHAAFKVSGANNEGNLLFLERTNNPPKDYDIYIDWARYVGFDQVGRKLPYNDLPEILKRMENPKPENIIRFSKLEDRIDPWYYHPRYYELEKAIAKSSHPLKPISQVVDESDSLFRREEYMDKVFNYIEKNDVDSARGLIVSSEPMTGKTAKSRATYVLREGDFLIPNARDTIHGVAIVPKEYEGYVCTNRFFVVRPKLDEVLPVYLYHILRQPAILALLRRQATGEINPSLPTDALKRVKIPVPSPKEQEKLVEKLVENEQKKIALLAQIGKIDQSVMSLVGTSLPPMQATEKSLYILGYEFIASF